MDSCYLTKVLLTLWLWLSNISTKSSCLDPGEWSGWGEWSTCMDTTTWDRTRKCYDNSRQEIDRRFCVGKFIEYDKCKCAG